MVNFFTAIVAGDKKREDYESYRWFFTSSGKLVIGGKSAEQNEEIMSSVQDDDVIMHTSSPGSPFAIIKNPSEQDIEEAAIFTACFSHEWKRAKNKAEVHIFRGEQVTKNKGMKTGTFGVQGSIKRKKVELKLVLEFQKGKLRAVPFVRGKKKGILITPGNLDKNQATNKLMDIIKNKNNYPITRDEIMSAIPSDNMGIKEK
jgi:hypothetical protein